MIPSITDNEQSIWEFEKLYPGRPAYNLNYCIELKSAINTATLKEITQKIIDDSPGLNATYHEKNGLLYKEQAVKEFEFITQNLTCALDKQYLSTIVDKPLLHSDTPAVRIAYLHDDNNKKYVLCIIAHHIIMDFTSFSKFVLNIYNSYYKPEYKNQNITPHIKPRFSLDNKSSNQWWLEYLHNLPSGCYLVDEELNSNPIMDFTGDSLTTKLPQELVNKISKASRAAHVTPFTYLLQAFFCCLMHYCQKDSFVIGGTIQSHRGVDHANKTSAIPIVYRLQQNKSFQELCKKINLILIDIRKHADISTKSISQIHKSPNRAEETPLFQTLFSWDQAESNSNIFDTTALNEINSIINSSSSGIHGSQYRLTLSVFYNNHSPYLQWTYSTKHYRHEFIKQFSDFFLDFIDAAYDRKNTTPADIISSLATSNMHKYSYITGTDKDRNHYSIAESFHNTADTFASRTAIIFREKKTSYRQLKHNVITTANNLKRLGVQPGEIVAVFLEKSDLQITTTIALMHLGATYLPIDITTPKNRIVSALKKSGASHLVLEKQQRYAIEFNTINVHDLLQSSCDTSATPAQLNTNDALYIIFTSGSSGEPKGVVSTHAGCVNRVLWMQQHLKVSHTDCILFKTSIAFDVSVWEILLPLLSGASVAIAEESKAGDPDYLLTIINRHKISIMHMVPSLLHVFIQLAKKDKARTSSLRAVIASGEALPTQTVNAFYNSMQGTLYNFYGPTEASIDVTSWQCSTDSKLGSTPIGYPIDNTKIFILNRDLQIIPRATKGTIYISGIALANGYVNDQARTEKSFLEQQTVCEHTIYNTGDCGYISTAGRLMYIGRNDEQIKLRGFRIELGEISATLLSMEEIEDAAVSLCNTTESSYLHAVITAKKTISQRRINDHLAMSLPKYMLPSKYSYTNKIPRLKSGKVNIAALKECQAPQGHNIATNDLHNVFLINTLEKLLGDTKIDANANLFSYGLNSILIIKLIAEIYDKTQQHLQAAEIFLSPTITDIDRLLVSSKSKHYSTSQNKKNKNPVKQVLSDIQKQIYFLQEKNAMSSAYNVYRLIKLDGNMSTDSLMKAIKTLIKLSPAFNSYISVESNNIYSLTTNQAQTDFVFQDLSHMEANKAQSKIRFICKNMASQGLQINEPGSSQIYLFKTSVLEHYIFINMHHVFCDGLSMALIFNNLASIYSGNQAYTASLLHQYHQVDSDNKKYWSNKYQVLTGQLEDVNIFTNMHDATETGSLVGFVLNKHATAAHRLQSSKNNNTLFIHLLTLLASHIRKTTQAKSFAIGTTFANRPNSSDQNKITCMASTIPIIIESNNKTDHEVAVSIKTNILEAHNHQNTPTSTLIYAAGNKIQPSGKLFNIMLTLLDESEFTIPIPSVTTHALHIDNNTSKYDLLIYCIEKKHNLEIIFQYNTASINDANANKFISTYIQNLNGMEPASIINFSDHHHTPKIVDDNSKAACAMATNKQTTAPLIISAIEQTLGIDDVNEDDSFFHLGGDSISAILLKHSLESVGIRIRIKDIFKHQTAKSISEVTCNPQPHAVTAYDYSTFPLLPMQDWFFRHDHKHPQQWIHATVLEYKGSLTAKELEQHLASTLSALDCFNIEFTMHDGQWRQKYSKKANYTIKRKLLITDQTCAEEEAKQNISSLSISNNILANINIYTKNDEVVSVGMCIHHLLIDGASWPILIKQINCFSRKNNSPHLTSNILAQASKLKQSSQISYFDITRNAELVSDEIHHNITIPSSTIKQIKNKIKLMGLESLEHYYITSILKSLSKYFSRTHLSFAIESSDRNTNHNEINIESTIGWLSKFTKVRLDIDRLTNNTSISEQIKMVADTITLQSETTQPSDSMQEMPEICINYLGNLDCVNTQDNDLKLQSLHYLSNQENFRPFAIEINIHEFEKQLHINISYTLRSVINNDISHLEQNISQHLCEIINQTVDIRLTNLQRLIAKQYINKRAEISKHFNLATWEFHGTLDKNRFKQAWVQTVQQTQALRYCYTASNNCMVEPLAAITDINITYLDWSTLEPEQVQRMYDDLRSSEQFRPLGLQHAPMMRITLIKTRINTHKVIWCMHQALLDGWSVIIFFQQLAKHYNSNINTQLDIMPNLSDYTNVLADNLRNKNKTKKFFETYLSEFYTVYYFALYPIKYTDMTQLGNNYCREISKIDSTLLNMMHNTAREHGVTLSVIFNAAWSIYLQARVKGPHSCYGLMVSSRASTQRNTKLMLGAIANIVILKIDFTTNKTLTQHLSDVQNTILGIRCEGHYPLDKQAQLSLQSTDTYPIDNMINFQNYPEDNNLAEKFDKLKIKNVDVFERTNVPLSLRIEAKIDATLKLTYNDAMIKPGTVRDVLASYEAVIRLLVDANHNTLLNTLIMQTKNKLRELCHEMI
jgi:amino acid adenylation domain-containing protein